MLIHDYVRIISCTDYMVVVREVDMKAENFARPSISTRIYKAGVG
jgi:hypothetical protein